MTATVAAVIEWLNHMPPDATVSVEMKGQVRPIRLVSGDLPRDGKFQRIILHADDARIGGSYRGEPV